MKKRFLLFVTVLMAGFSTIATAQTTDNLLSIAGIENLDLTGSTAYYLKNVGTGLYMSYGGEWGTHCIETQQSHPIVVEDNEDGTVAIGSIGGYLESNTLWMDSTKTASKWTLVKVEGYENQYYLYGDGNRVLTSVGNSAGLLTLNTLANIAMQRWIFTNGADIKNNKMPNASVDAPFDVTVSIRGGSFDLADGWDQTTLTDKDGQLRVPKGIRNSTLPNPYFGNWKNYAANSKWIWNCGTRDWDPNAYAWCGIINGNADALTVTYTMTLPKGTYHFSFEGFYKYMKVVSEQKQTRPMFGSWSNDGNPTITTTDNGTMNASVSIAGQSFALKSYGSDNSIYDNGALAAAVFRDNDTYEHHCTFYVSEESQEVSIVITKPSTTAGGESTSGGGTFSTSRTVTTTSYPSQIYIDDFTLLYYGEDDVTATAKENANYISYLNANITEYKAQLNDEGDTAFDEVFKKVNINNVVTRADYYNALAILEEARKAGVLAHNKAEIQKEAIESGRFTDAIYNHSFELGTTEGWTIGENTKGGWLDTGVRPNANETFTTKGIDGIYLFNAWSAANQGLPITQTIEGLPNGTYKMQVLVASDPDATIYLLANDTHKAITITQEKTVFEDQYVKFEVTDGTATIGVVGGNTDGSYVAEGGDWWYKCDNFRLEYLGDDHLKLDQASTKIEKFNEEFKQVTINRSLAADRWYTFVVPFDMAIPTGWTVKELSRSTLNDDKITLEFTTVDSIKAGVPYMVRTNSAVSNGDITSKNTHVNTNTTVEAPSTEHVKFVATYTSGNVPEGCYFISNNVFYRAADETNTIKGFRAYFEPIGEAAKARQLTYRFASDDYEEGTTAIDDAQFTTDNAQTIVYDLMGRRIENPTKGIYIVNGKKVMIKE